MTCSSDPSQNPPPAPPRRDDETDAMIEQAFPSTSASGGEGRSACQVFAVIPQEIIEASPEEFAAFLESVFDTGEDLDEVLDRLLKPTVGSGRAAGGLRAVLPAAALRQGGDPTTLLDQVFEAFDEIETVLTELHAQARPEQRGAPAVAVVDEEDLADPERLLSVIDRMQSESGKLELLFRQAKHALHRLSRYRLSRKPPGALVGLMRTADEVRTLQYLVEFLHSVQTAADSFEKLALPRPHIRDYLEYLYRMEDWEAMSVLVRRLERAVLRYLSAEHSSG